MSQKEKTYEEVTDAKDMIKSLCEKYPDELWAVRPDAIIVLGINNKERPEKTLNWLLAIQLRELIKP